MASPSTSATVKPETTNRQIRGRAPGATPPFPIYTQSGNATAAAANATTKNNLKRTISLAFMKKVGRVDVGVEATELAAGESCLEEDGKKARKLNGFKESVVQSISKFKNRNKLNNSSQAESPLDKENTSSSGMDAATPAQSKFSIRFRREKLEEIKKCSEEEIVTLQNIIQKEVDNFLKTKDGLPDDTVVMSKTKYESLCQQLHDVESLLKQKREEEEERKLQHSSLDPNEVSSEKNSGHIPDEDVPSEKPEKLEQKKSSIPKIKNNDLPIVEKKSKRQNAEPKAAAPSAVQFRFPGDDTVAKENAGADDVDGTIEAEKEHELVENNFEYVENPDEKAQEFEKIQKTSEEFEGIVEEFEEIAEAVEEFEKIEGDFEEILKVEKLQIKQDANDSFDGNWEFLEKDDMKDIKTDNLFVVPSTPYKVPIWDDTGVSSGWRHIGFVDEMEKAQKTD